MDEPVCEICGSSRDRKIMANCAQCNAYQHCYCLQMVTYDIPDEWYCDECQKNANGDPEPSQGGQAEFQGPFHGCDLTMERQTPTLDNNDRNVVHRTGLKTSKKFENAKVKFISCEEATLLSKERSPHCRSNFTARRTYSQVRPASPPKVKQSSSMKCMSPSRSDTQVCALKRCAVASQNPAKIEDINMKPKARSGGTIPMVLPCGTSRAVKGRIGSQIQCEPREKKLVSADKEKINYQIQDETRKKSPFNASDADTGCESEMKSLHHNIDMPVVINSSVEYARRPPPTSCWTGCFFVFDGTNCNFGEYQAYFPSKVSSKVCDIAKKMPNNIQLEMLHRMDDWPKSFETNRPVYEDIGLFFFSNELDWHEKKHPPLLETYCNFVMRAHIDDVKLLIYSSEVLPPDSQWIDGESYLWGVFVKSKGKSNPARFGSIAI